MTTAASVLDAIGNTPLIRLRAASEATGCEILGKAEFMNPGQSVKDRAALGIIRDAEAKGLLRPGGRIVEGTAGNTGIGLAMVAAALGYKTTIVIPRTQSQEKKDAIRLLGAQLVEVDAVPYSNPDNYVRYSGRLAEELAKTEPNGVIWANQFDNTANRRAHYEGTGPEILKDVPEITHFIAGLGTAGTLMGVGTYLKDHKPGVQVWAIEPPAGEMVDGLKNFDEGFVPPVFTEWGGYELLDRKMIVRPRESIEWTRRLTEVGVFAGLSSGAIVAGAAKCAASIDEGAIVMIACDAGWKYLSTDAWTADLDDVEARAKSIIYF